MGRLVELSHVIEEGMPVYPGVPPPVIGAVLTREKSRARYEGRAEFLLGKVEMPGNTGTYVDSPFHRHAEGPDLAGIPLEAVAGLAGVVVDASPGPERAIAIDSPDDALRGRAVLVRTGWDSRWGTDAYWEPGPYLGPGSLDRLIGAGAALVGVDFWNVDDTQDPARPAHTRLLGEGIPIVEHLANLGELPAEGFRFYAVAPPIVGGASFPVRAFAEVEG